MFHSSHSPTSSFSLQPPLSPAFYPMLSPLLPPSSTSATPSTSFTSSTSRRSTSPLLLSTLPPSSLSLSIHELSTSVSTLSTSFLTDVAIHDVTEVPSSSAHRPPYLHLLPRSVFGSHSTSASSSSFSPALMSTPELHADNRHEDEPEDERHTRRYPFRIGSLDVLSDVVLSAESANEVTVDTEPHSPQSDTSPKKKGAYKGGSDVERRVARACIHCSASKTKCDNKRPCGRCVRTKRASTCQDIPRRKRLGRSKRPREVEESDASVAVKEEDDSDSEVAASSPAMARCVTSNEAEMGGSHVVTWTSHMTVAPHAHYGGQYASHPVPFAPHTMYSPYEWPNHPAHYVPLHDHPPHYWQPPSHPHTHTYPFPPYPYMHPHPAAHSVFASPTPNSAGVQQEAPYSPQQRRTAPPTPLLSPTHTAVASPAASVGPSARPPTATPNSPATSQSTAASVTSPSLPISQLLSRLRLRLPRSLHRAHGAVIDQFHQWSDLLAVRQQQGLTAPAPLLKARQYVYHMLMDAMVALEDGDRQRRMAVLLAGSGSSSSSPPPPIFSPPLESEHDELLRLIHKEWDEHLFPRSAAAADSDEADGNEWDNKVKTGTPTLDAVLQCRVVTPTFIIPLLSFPFLTAAPWLSASFSTLLGYDAAVLSASTQSPLDLLHHRQHADIAPLVPAFLSAITAKADHYLHSSGWVRQGGDSVHLMANVRVMYAEGSGFPVALMAQFARKEQADASFAPILARMGNAGTVSAVGGSV